MDYESSWNLFELEEASLALPPPEFEAYKGKYISSIYPQRFISFHLCFRKPIDPFQLEYLDLVSSIVFNSSLTCSWLRLILYFLTLYFIFYYYICFSNPRRKNNYAGEESTRTHTHTYIQARAFTHTRIHTNTCFGKYLLQESFMYLKHWGRSTMLVVDRIWNRSEGKGKSASL
jgi:hypothetical protein